MPDWWIRDVNEASFLWEWHSSLPLSARMWYVIFYSLTELTFTYHKLGHKFTIFLSKFIELCNYHCNPILKHFHYPNSFLLPFSVSTHCCQPQTVTYMPLFLWLWLFWTFHINAIIQYIVLCIWQMWYEYCILFLYIYWLIHI